MGGGLERWADRGTVQAELDCRAGKTIAPLETELSKKDFVSLPTLHRLARQLDLPTCSCSCEKVWSRRQRDATKETLKRGGAGGCHVSTKNENELHATRPLMMITTKIVSLLVIG